MNWSAAFTDLPPIRLADGRTLKTRADCRAYIPALPVDALSSGSISDCAEIGFVRDPTLDSARRAA